MILISNPSSNCSNLLFYTSADRIDCFVNGQVKEISNQRQSNDEYIEKSAKNSEVFVTKNI